MNFYQIFNIVAAILVGAMIIYLALKSIPKSTNEHK